MKKKKIAILGSTGSIGTQALDIIQTHKESYQAAVLSCAKNISLLRMQIQEFHPAAVVVKEKKDWETLKQEFPEIVFYHGAEGLREVVRDQDYDLLLNALVGMQGLVPTYEALSAGRDVALANKETLVAGGDLIMKTAWEKGVKLLPVDSEHSAIFQCLEGNRQNRVKRLLITASGGPFRGYTPEMLEQVTLEQALKHPNWRMGNKITIDSATLMNKGLEVIEAHHLFQMPGEQIDVLVHPQSIIHSMVEYEDRSVMAQLGLPDMRVPIAYAFSYPSRMELKEKSLDLAEIATLTFQPPDREAFPCLDLAYDALREGKGAPSVLNGANEVLVAAFLKEEIRFSDISRILQHTMERYTELPIPDLPSGLEADKEGRRLATEMLRKKRQ